MVDKINQDKVIVKEVIIFWAAPFGRERVCKKNTNFASISDEVQKPSNSNWNEPDLQ